jgi:predicted Zn-dependent peptidase
MELTQIKSNRLEDSYFIGVHESGLKVYIYPKTTHSSFAILGTKFGSINTKFIDVETSKEVCVPDGIAHYLEHKLFENEDGDSFKKFAKTGAFANAYTSFDVTAYLFSCTENFFESLDILLDFTQKPYFTDKSVEKERGIIAQEIKMYDDDPSWKVENNLLLAMYHKHPVRINIAGNVESILRITPQMLYDCYKNFYNLNNMTLCITGNVNKDDVVDIIEKKIKVTSAVKPKIIFPEEPDEILKNRIEQKFDLAIPSFKLGFKEHVGKNDLSFEKIVFSDLILEVFASKSSKLYRKLLDENLINSSFDFDFFEGPGYASTVFSGESKNPDKVGDIIREEVLKFKEDGIKKDDFERAKKTIYADYVSFLDSCKKTADLLFHFSLNNRDYFSCMELAASAKLEDVEKRLKEILNPDKSSLSIVSPLK